MVSQTIGVIQGSKCSPMFYDIYSSVISQLGDSDEYLKFADNTCTIFVSENLNELIQHVNNRLAASSNLAKMLITLITLIKGFVSTLPKRLKMQLHVDYK